MASNWLTDILSQYGPASGDATGQVPLAPEVPVATPVVAPQAQAPVEQPPVELTPAAATASGLLSPFAQPRAADYQAPRIQIPKAADNALAEAELSKRLEGIQAAYKTDLQGAKDKQFNSEVFASIGNYLPQAIAGATAMNTKANVQAPKLKEIVTGDLTAPLTAKYKTDYEGLLDKYKALKGGDLTAKDQLYASIAQAQLDQGAARLNNNIETTDKNAGIRVGNAILADEKGSELSEKQIDSLAGYDDTLTSLGRIQEQKKKVDTGPLANARNKLASTVGIDDPEVTSLRSEVVDTLAAKIKALSGTAANESEVKRLEVTLPGIGDSDEIFNRKLVDAEKRIKEARKIREDHFKSKQNKNTAGYSQPVKQAAKTVAKTEYSPSRNQTRITYSDGTTEVKDGK